MSFFATNQGIVTVFSLANVITLDKMDLKNTETQQTKSPTPAPAKLYPTRKPVRTKAPTPAPTRNTNGDTNAAGTAYRIRNRWKGTYLTHNTAEIGATLALVPLNQQWCRQRWALDPVNPVQFPKQYHLRNLWEKMFYCLPQHNAEDFHGTPVVAYYLVKNWWSLRWELEIVESNLYRLRNSGGAGRYLTVGSKGRC